MLHNSKDDTYKTGQELLGYHMGCDNDRKHYTRELVQHRLATAWA